MKKLFFISIVSLMFMGCISTSDIYGNKDGNFYVKNDDVRQTTSIRHTVFCNMWKTGFQYNLEIINNRLYLVSYLPSKEWHFLYRGVFLNEDGQRFEFKLSDGSRKVHKDGTISETYMNRLGDDEIEKLKSVITGKNPCVAYLGEKYDIPKKKIDNDIISAYLETFDKYNELKK